MSDDKELLTTIHILTMTEANKNEDVESELKVVGQLDSCGGLVRGESCAGDGATDPYHSLQDLRLILCSSPHP